MANINVSYADIRDAASRLIQGQDEITTKLNELDTLINNLVDSGYVTDQSSRAFNENFDKFITGTKNGIEGLEGLSKFLTSAADALESTDEGLANSINGA